MMKQYKIYKKSILCLCLLSIALIILFFVLFINSVRKANEERINFEMSKISSEAESNINKNVRALFNNLELKSQELGSSFDNFNDETIAKLDDLFFTNDYYKLCIINKNGIAYINNGDNITFSKDDFIFKALSGEKAVSDLVNVPEFSEDLVAFAVPVKNNEKTIGAIVALVTPEAIGQYTDYSSEREHTYIINQMGTILNSTEDNFFTMLSSFKLKGDFSKTDFENDLFSNSSDMFEYSENSVRKYAYYKPHEVNGWFVVTCIEKDYIFQDFNITRTQFIYLFLKVLIVILIFFIINALLKKRYINEWKICEESFEFFKKNSMMVFFEINIKTHEAFFSENITTLLGFNPKLTDVTDAQIISDAIHKEDIDNVKEYFEEILFGKNPGEIEFRFRTGLNTYMPVRVITEAVNDRRNKLIKIIGSLSTAEKQCLLSAHSSEVNRRDPLTNLTNKLGTKTKVDDYCQENSGEKGALLIAEIVNLNYILSFYESSLIDKMVVESVENMLKLFRSTDIIGRTGENEFAILMKKVDDESLIIEKATAVQNIFNNAVAKMGITHEIIISIGISCYPDDAHDFTGLYKKSNDAVLQASPQTGRIIFFNSGEALEAEKV